MPDTDPGTAMSDAPHYDVVIVGAGAAGCPLAHRLAAESDLRVLLLEAGPDARPDTVAVPARWPENLFGPLDHGYSTVPQRGAGGRVVPAPRGRVLGGTTAINAMIHSRPGPDDLDPWGPGWTYDDCAGALEAMESHRGGGPTRGTTGPAVNGWAAEPNQLNLDFLEASLDAGHPAAHDINAPGAEGAARFDLSIGDDGLRADAAQSYLRSVPPRSNLTVWADVVVQRLHVSGGRVTALTIERDSVVQELPVPGQLVLSAGAIDTPALLLRSGIGPSGELRACGIEPVVDLPAVGRNLHDHPSLAVIWSTEKVVAPPRHQFAETALLLRHARQTHGQTVSFAFHHLAMLPVEASPPSNGATTLIGLYEPFSRGSLTLDPDDPDAPPLIDPGYLTDERDVRALAAAVEVARDVAAQAALEEYELVELSPGPGVQGTEMLQEFVRLHVGTYGHPVGTCAMGDGDDGVVDRRLRLRGLANVRIADASVIPAIPGVAPSATVQMIGWRAAEFILAEGVPPAAGRDAAQRTTAPSSGQLRGMSGTRPATG